MVEEWKLSPANPSSVHSMGRAARVRLSDARNRIAKVLNVKASELLFTSGATEAMNALTQRLEGHIITTDIEHPSLQVPIQRYGDRVTYLQTGTWGAVLPEQVEQAIRPETRYIIMSAVNSETGVKQPIGDIAKIAKERGIHLIVDAVAWFGKDAFEIPPGVSAMVFSSHKVHGPTGIGLIWLSPHFKFTPMILGGHQEYERRAGTENLPAIMGLAMAFSLIELPKPELRDYLEEGIREFYPEMRVNGLGPRVHNTTNIAFAGIDGEMMLMELDMAGIAVSLGSACSSGGLEPSRVLLNMGLSRELARSSIRFSLSRYTTREEITYVLETLKKLCRQRSPLVR